MGVTIRTKNKSINVGYGGFLRLRTKVAYLVSDELGKFYDELSEGLALTGDKRKKFFDKYDARLSQIDDELGVNPLIIDFLYAPDAGAVMTPKHTRCLYKLIKDYDDDVLYGYWGRPDCARFKDFKEVVKDSRDHNIQMRWR